MEAKDIFRLSVLQMLPFVWWKKGYSPSEAFITVELEGCRLNAHLRKYPYYPTHEGEHEAGEVMVAWSPVDRVLPSESAIKASTNIKGTFVALAQSPPLPSGNINLNSSSTYYNPYSQRVSVL